MNWLDVLIIIALGTSVAIGVLRGFVRECFSLASYVIGYLMASGTYAFFAARLYWLIKNPQARIILCFGIIFIVTVILVNLAGRLLRKLISKAKGLSMVDRIVGLIFGFCRGVLILSLIMIPVSLFPVLGSDSIRNSTLAPSLKIVSRELAAWAFSEKNIVKSSGIKNGMDFLKEKVDDGIDSLKKATSAGKTGKDASGISQKDREKLNQLLEKL
ncbi:MAG: CvpA family protein [Nitrospinae bacterium]|nr:CvpA family protein [Nitrospinota bacterium]